MKRTNMLKTIVCASMLVVTMCTTALAGTVTSEKEVRGSTTYGDEYDGSVGIYYAAGTSTQTKTTALNDSQTQRLYYVTSGVYNYTYQKLYLKDTDTDVLGYSDTLVQTYSRVYNSAVVDYYHNAVGFVSTSSNVKLDDYTFWGLQYYR